MSSLTESERESLIEENWKWVVDYIDEKDAEIERLKALITELADALEHADWTSDYEQRWKNNDLIQRAREATR